MFVGDLPVPIGDANGNTISIRPKMPFGVRNACMDALAAVSQNEGGRAAMSLHLGAYQSALLTHNIVAWSGPAFAGVDCSPANIARLDPDEPLVVRVLEEISARNPLKNSRELAAEKKKATNAGGPPSAESTSPAGPGTIT